MNFRLIPIARTLTAGALVAVCSSPALAQEEPHTVGAEDAGAQDDTSIETEESTADDQGADSGAGGETDPQPDEIPEADAGVPDEEQRDETVSQEPVEPQADPDDYYTDREPFVPTMRHTDDYSGYEEPPYDGPFRAGQIQLGISIGYQATVDQSWFIPGVSVGYFLANGLLVHVDTDFWIGDPFVATPSPGLQYIFYMIPTVNPYLGAFYRHYFVGGGYLDADSLGGRAGVYILTGSRSYFGGGIVYERMLQEDLFSDPNLIYPEFAFVFSF